MIKQKKTGRLTSFETKDTVVLDRARKARNLVQAFVTFMQSQFSWAKECNYYHSCLLEIRNVEEIKNTPLLALFCLWLFLSIFNVYLQFCGVWS